MLVKDLWCDCESRTFPLDHYASGACPSPPGPPALVNAILTINAQDDRHTGGRLSATRLTTCPRKVVIEDNIPSTLDVKGMISQTHGTLINQALDRYLPPGWKAQIPVAGRLFKRQFPPEGVLVEGTVDLLSSDGTEVPDYKFHSSKSLAMKWQKPAEPELRSQLSVYAKLLRQMDPSVAPKRLVAWHGASTAKSDKPPSWFPQPIEEMTEDEIAGLRPFGMRYTVAEIIAFHRRFKDEVAKIAQDTPDDERIAQTEAAVRRVPAAGTASSWLCQYCRVKRSCDRLEGLVFI